jgi:hypothetical protein
MVLAALMLAVEERQPKATQAEGDLLPNANSTTVESVVAKSSHYREAGMFQRPVCAGSVMAHASFRGFPVRNA